MTGAVPLLAILFHDCLVIIRLHYHETCTGWLMPESNQFHAVSFFVPTRELSLGDVNQLFLDGIGYFEQHFHPLVSDGLFVFLITEEGKTMLRSGSLRLQRAAGKHSRLMQTQSPGLE